MEEAFTRLGPPVYLWLYEDFVQMPAALLEALQEFLGLEVLGAELRDFEDPAARMQGKEGGGNLPSQVENYAEIRAYIRANAPELESMLNPQWKFDLDLDKTFQDLCTEYGPRMAAGHTVRHLGWQCEAGGKLVRLKSAARPPSVASVAAATDSDSQTESRSPPAMTPYVIVKAARTGSKTVHSMLMAHNAIRDTFEPKDTSEAAIRAMLSCRDGCDFILADEDLRGRAGGARHVEEFCGWARSGLPAPLGTRGACGFSVNMGRDPDTAKKLMLGLAQRLVFMTRANIIENAVSGSLRPLGGHPELTMELEPALVLSMVGRAAEMMHLLNAQAFQLPVPSFLYLYEDFIQQPDATISAIYEFLNVDVPRELPRDFSDPTQRSRGKEGGGMWGEGGGDNTKTSNLTPSCCCCLG